MANDETRVASRRLLCLQRLAGNADQAPRALALTLKAEPCRDESLYVLMAKLELAVNR